MNDIVIFSILTVLSLAAFVWVYILISGMDKENKNLQDKNKQLVKQTEEDRLKGEGYEQAMDAMGDKISDKLLNMMKGLKGLPEAARAERMQEIQNIAEAENVDLSSLYAHDEIKSNIDEIGIDEKEVKGIDKNLEKLRKMRKNQGGSNES